jgi:general L-amino acid transport system permease protein
MTDMQQPPSQGVVHGIAEESVRAPEPPPSGPVVWIQENLIAGDSLPQRFFNGVLTVVFALIGVGLIRYVTGFFFSPERRWSAVTVNMKLLMVQAFPRADLWRIWVSIGIFFVLLAMTLAVWRLNGRISIHKTATGARAAAIFLLLVVILHPNNPPSGGRIVIGLIAIVLGVIAHLVVRAFAPRKDETIPFLSLLVVGMAAILAVIWTIELPFPTGQFEQALQPIATTTTIPWTILFIVAIAAYWVGKLINPLLQEGRLRKILTILWVASYPIIIMVIQRKPILEWADIFGFGDTPFLQSDLGTLLLFGILGSALLWWMALPNSRTEGQLYTGVVVLAVVVGIWLVPEAPTWVALLITVVGLGVGGLAAVGVQEPTEQARLIGSLLVVMALMVWFVPMLFLYRTLVIIFALVAIAAPSFGGTVQGRTRIIRFWLLLLILTVITFRLGEASTALEFASTSFLGGFNLTILLAITGVVLSFPVGAVLALARTSTMPIFRLLATAYIELVRSVPLITWLFFGSVMLALFLPQGVEFDEIVRIVAAVTIFSAAYVAENLRGGLQSIGKGQYEAARAMGLTTVQSTALIIMPQAIRAVIPALVGSVIVAFKDTSLVAIIGLADVLWIAKTAIPGQTTPFNFLGTQPQMMFFMALFYWVFTFTFSRLSLRYEKSIGLGTR